jgi:hypothetical protein
MKRQNNSPPVPDAGELQRQVESLQQSIHRLQLEHEHEPPRILRRLFSLRGLSHEEVKQVLT